METMTRKKRKRSPLLPLVLVAAATLTVVLVLVFRSLLPVAQREEPDPHAGQIYVNDPTKGYGLYIDWMLDTQ